MSKTDNEASLKWYLGFYVGLAGLACFASIMQQYLTYSSTIYAARRLFRRLLHSVLHAPIDFLNRNPLGRILNRFSADTAIIDGQVGQILGVALTSELRTAVDRAAVARGISTPDFVRRAITGALAVDGQRVTALPDLQRGTLPGLLDAVLEGTVVRSRRALRGRGGAEHLRDSRCG